MIQNDPKTFSYFCSSIRHLCYSLCGRIHFQPTATSSDLPQRFNKFDEYLRLQLENLNREGEVDGKLLRCSWLASFLAIALEDYVEDASAFCSLDLIYDETWILEYMDQSARMLDACNVLMEALSRLQHGLLLVRHAWYALADVKIFPLGEQRDECTRSDVNEEQVSVALKSLRKWMHVQGSSEGHLQKLSHIMQHMINPLDELHKRSIAKESELLYSLFLANVRVVLALYMLSLALLQEKGLLSLNLSFPHAISWASTVSGLVQMGKDEVNRQKVMNLCLQDLIPLYANVQELVCMIEQGLESNRVLLSEIISEWLAESGHNLSLQTDQIANSLELLRAKLDELFNAIVLSRSLLLDKLGGSETDKSPPFG
ncbi:hypothetical protein KP509_28G046900 [Ceratopteris richardii]|uniref:Uncharacterized protein n=1 Tax=Ceratopteris richardii TaxID=49495 RepID=A0A8T2REC3_CERRI|nr:hypothetical protein KP509_28G046900 [Ceratopteris richardii]